MGDGRAVGVGTVPVTISTSICTCWTSLVLRVIRIDNATRSLHTECHLYAADFVIGSVGLSSQMVCADTPVTLEISTRLRALRACHHARTQSLDVNP